MAKRKLCSERCQEPSANTQDCGASGTRNRIHVIHLRQRVILCVRETRTLTNINSVTSSKRSASSKEDILESGTTVASLFFKNVFGSQTQQALTVFVALRCVLRAIY